MLFWVWLNLQRLRTSTGRALQSREAAEQISDDQCARDRGSVSLLALSGMFDAHVAAEVAASAAVLTARCAVPLRRSTCTVALSATLSTVWCAAMAALSTLAPAGMGFEPPGGLLLPLPLSVVLRSMMCPFGKIDEETDQT